MHSAPQSGRHTFPGRVPVQASVNWTRSPLVPLLSCGHTIIHNTRTFTCALMLIIAPTHAGTHGWCGFDHIPVLVAAPTGSVRQSCSSFSFPSMKSCTCGVTRTLHLISPTHPNASSSIPSHSLTVSSFLCFLSVSILFCFTLFLAVPVLPFSVPLLIFLWTSYS